MTPSLYIDSTTNKQNKQTNKQTNLNLVKQVDGFFILFSIIITYSKEVMMQPTFYHC